MHNLSDPKNTEELLAFLVTLGSDDNELMKTPEFSRIDIALNPPQDGQDRDIDDYPSDGEGEYGIGFIVKVVLKQPFDVFTRTRGNEKLKQFSGEIANKDDASNLSEEEQNNLCALRITEKNCNEY